MTLRRDLVATVLRPGVGCFLFLGFTFTAVGCVPSLRVVQQGHVYFERCYAADFDPQIPLAEKHACWNAWLSHYTTGQSRERVRYARRRLYQIEHGRPVPRLPGLPEAGADSRDVVAISEPGPAESTRGANESSPAEPAEMAADRESPLPQNTNPACAALACEPAWRACMAECADNHYPCQDACRVELHACARGCF